MVPGNMTHDDLTTTLANIPLFASLDVDELGMIAHATHYHRLLRGEMLFQKGDPAIGFYYYFRNKATKVILSMEGLTLDLIKVLRNVEIVEE